MPSFRFVFRPVYPLREPLFLHGEVHRRNAPGSETETKLMFQLKFNKQKFDLTNCVSLFFGGVNLQFDPEKYYRVWS